MRRIASIWLPVLAIERWAKDSDLPPDAPVVLTVEGTHGLVIHAVTQAAAERGARAGARLTDARALDPALMAVIANRLDTIETVQSHPMALAQCKHFFELHPRLKSVIADDTAGSVAEVIRNNDPKRAAIASRRAAELYGGTIIRQSIQDHSDNYTRFVLLSAPAEQKSKEPTPLVKETRS